MVSLRSRLDGEPEERPGQGPGGGRSARYQSIENARLACVLRNDSAAIEVGPGPRNLKTIDGANKSHWCPLAGPYKAMRPPARRWSSGHVTAQKSLINASGPLLLYAIDPDNCLGLCNNFKAQANISIKLISEPASASYPQHANEANAVFP